MVNSIEFTKRLEKILSFYGLSATAFAEKIAFNRSTISHLLSGRNKPSLEFVMKVVKTFPEVELYWLLNGKGDFPPTQPSYQNTKESIEFSETKTNEEQTTPPSENLQNSEPRSSSSNDTSIERIIIFYKNGSFKEYLP